jgi:hypothetical protein
VTGDTATGRLLGAQLIGRRGTEVAKRVDTYAAALFHSMTVDAVSELDLSYTPPLGSPWDAVQMATQAWVGEHQLTTQQQAARGWPRPAATGRAGSPVPSSGNPAATTGTGRVG